MYSQADRITIGSTVLISSCKLLIEQSKMMSPLLNEVKLQEMSFDKCIE